jgi:hypothetical protein
MATTSGYSLPTNLGQTRTLDVQNRFSCLRAQGPVPPRDVRYGGDAPIVPAPAKQGRIALNSTASFRRIRLSTPSTDPRSEHDRRIDVSAAR